MRTLLTAVKVGVVAALVVGPTAGLVHDAAAGSGATGGECARTGHDHRPAPALIRTDQGRVRQVSFEVAWDVYEGRRPGTVLSVCVDGAPGH